MIKNFLVICMLAAAPAVLAQNGKPTTGVKTTGAVKTTVAAKPTAPVLKTAEDSVSYAVGISVANFYKQQGISKLNTSLISRAINDLMGGKKPLLDDAAANQVMNDYMNKMQAKKSKPAIEAGEKFLAQNKTKAGVVTTGSGLQYEVLTEGTGAQPLATDSVTCHYKGTLLDGTVFDNSYDRGTPITFFLSGVIRGWTEGVQLMKEGAKYKFYIPYQLAYGPNDYGPIPGGSMLTFEVELLKVIKPAAN